jgi:hypothetical protein
MYSDADTIAKKLELAFPHVVYSSVYMLFYFILQNYCSTKMNFNTCQSVLVTGIGAHDK